MWESRSPPFFILIKISNSNLIFNNMRFFYAKNLVNIFSNTLSCHFTTIFFIFCNSTIFISARYTVYSSCINITILLLLLLLLLLLSLIGIVLNFYLFSLYSFLLQNKLYPLSTDANLCNTKKTP